VADGIYHLGFAIANDRLLNEDGTANAGVPSVAFWLNELLADDLQGTALRNPALQPDQAAIDAAAVYSISGPILFSGTAGTPVDVVEVPHTAAMEVADGSIAVRFAADNVVGRHTLFSEDAKGYGAGQISAYVKDGHVEVKLETATQSVTLCTPAGSVRAGDEHQLTVSFGKEGFRLYLDGVPMAARTDVTVGLNANLNNLVLGGNTASRSSSNPTLTSDLFAGTLKNFSMYGRALNRFEVELIGRTPAPPTAGTTGTGLDKLVDVVLRDWGLNAHIPASEIQQGAAAADAMDKIIVEAIKATGVANDGVFSAGDVRDLNTYIRAHYLTQWITLHGNDEGSVETGFHLAQGDGGTTQLFAQENAVNTVADGIYHLGFAISGDRLLNEDGNANACVSTVAYWLNELLAAELKSGVLASSTTTVTTIANG
jgi:hypothetical protein